MYSGRGPWLPAIVRVALFGVLAGFNLGVAQIGVCPNFLEEARVVHPECPNSINPFGLTVAPATQSGSPLQLNVVPKRSHQGVDSQMITLEEWRHVPPKKAKKEKECAERALEKNHQEEAMGHLKTAIEIDPGFVQARNDLAVLYIRMGDPGPGIHQLNEAINLDPHSPILATNLAAGYIIAGKYEDAERAARVAVQQDRTGRQPRYILAAALYYQKRYTDEALASAERTSDQYPAAHLFAARILMHRREFERARVEIKAYLSANGATPEFADTANSWLDFMTSYEREPAPISPR